MVSSSSSSSVYVYVIKYLRPSRCITHVKEEDEVFLCMMFVAINEAKRSDVLCCAVGVNEQSKVWINNTYVCTDYSVSNVPLRQERPYHSDSTASRLLSEVKHCRARLVLRWGTTLESLVLFFCSFFLLHFIMYYVSGRIYIYTSYLPPPLSPSFCFLGLGFYFYFRCFRFRGWIIAAILDVF